MRSKPTAMLAGIPAVILAALAILCCARPVEAQAGDGVFDPGFAYVDADNDGRFGRGDIALDASLFRDGLFNTSVAKGSYVPPSGPAGLVIPPSVGSITNSGSQGIYLYAGKDLTIGADIKASGIGIRYRLGGVFLSARDGSIHVLEGTRITGLMAVSLVAGNDLVIDGSCVIQAKSRVGATLSMRAMQGELSLGPRSQVLSGGFCFVDSPAGPISSRPGSLVRALGNLTVNAQEHVTLDGSKVSAVLISIGSEGGNPARASLTGCIVRSTGRDGAISIRAPGGIIDLTGTKLAAADPSRISLVAGTVVGR